MDVFGELVPTHHGSNSAAASAAGDVLSFTVLLTLLALFFLVSVFHYRICSTIISKSKYTHLALDDTLLTRFYRLDAFRDRIFAVAITCGCVRSSCWR